MIEKVMVPLKDLATENATLDQLRYWLKLLGITPEVTRRIAYLTPEQAEQVTRMITAVTSGTSPREAAAKISPNPELLQPLQMSPADRVESLENAILKLAEEMCRARTETAGQITRLVSEVRELKQENAKLRAAVDPDAKVRAWLAGFAEPIPQNPETARDRYERLCADQISHVLLLEH